VRAEIAISRPHDGAPRNGWQRAGERATIGITEKNREGDAHEAHRMENGKVVEHWDVIQEVREESKTKNANGML
jgi:predicted SnoaL-like aldol condensation-catalyzing enzyme